MSSTSTRAALSREVIALKALALTDQAGLGALSMRKLGTELGVEAMSLYHYVQNKDDLLDAICDQLFLEIDLPFDVPDDDWETAVRRGLTAFYDVLIKHPAALELFTSRPARSQESLRVLFWAYSRFLAVGLDVNQSCKALHTSVSFVMGHVALELGSLVSSSDDVDEEEVAALSDPVMIDFIREHAKVDSGEFFETGLDVLVAGLRATYKLA